MANSSTIDLSVLMVGILFISLLLFWMYT